MSKLPVALLAARLLLRSGQTAPAGLIVVVASEHRAEALARVLSQMDPDRTSIWFPAWDCLPYDRAAPSPDIMGRRMLALRALGDGSAGSIIVTTPEAMLQRTPPRAALKPGCVLKPGEALEVAPFAEQLALLGYLHADRVEEPGAVAIRGEVIDIYPPASKAARVTMLDGMVVGLHRFDPLSQRSIRELPRLRIDAVSEVTTVGTEGEVKRFPGMEHWLPEFYPDLSTLPTWLPAATLLVEPHAAERLDATLALIEEAYRDRRAADARDDCTRIALPPDKLYLTREEWTALQDRADTFPGEEPAAEMPRFFTQDKPGKVFAEVVKAGRAAGHRIVLASGRELDGPALSKQAERALGDAPVAVTHWHEVASHAPGTVLAMRLAADHGYIDETNQVTLITAADLLGHYARASSYHAVQVPWHAGDGEFAIGDAVIHTAHGVGVLRGLETLETGVAAGQDAVRLDYAHETTLLAPVAEMHALWRYGAPDQGLSLDRLDTDAWAKRSVKIAREIHETARGLVAMARQRDTVAALKIVPPRRSYDRFVAGFAFAPSPDQIHAIDDTLKDLASGRAMDRLVVGDVGFGKTEVALRAAAAAALAGHQVALVAPTTVLVRQHVHTFRQRFASLGIEVAHLSRLVSPAEAQATKDGLADGSIKIVIGTHALAAKDVRFKALGLLMVDEEQRFGAAEKAHIRALGTGVHVLTLTATPIPRTLQSALVGLQDLSVIATPPARRRPIRTLVSPFDTATIRTALTREHTRGGQSFVVVPRIEDLDGIAHDLEALLPDLTLATAHGRMDAQTVDETMVSFARGEADVLLATSIIESGLDVPRANTMIVCQAERFGLAQLHQLRGRVGRGSRQGTCYLMTDSAGELAESTARRLATLAMYDRLGSGMAISARDLDARGAGDLMGEDQAGHLKLIGLGLYQHFLQQAIGEARGETVEEWTPEIKMENGGHLPAAYIPEPEVRLNLYARIARLTDEHDLAALAEEIEDRFGPLPEPVDDLLATARLRSLCRSHGVARVDGGPKGIALTLRPGVSAAALMEQVTPAARAQLRLKDGRLIDGHETASNRERLQRAMQVLAALH